MHTLDRWKRRLSHAFTNWQQPMPLRRKLWLFTRNNTIKVIRRQDCCGHHGEPGC